MQEMTLEHKMRLPILSHILLSCRKGLDQKEASEI
jgi:hypothetical protein